MSRFDLALGKPVDSTGVAPAQFAELEEKSKLEELEEEISKLEEHSPPREPVLTITCPRGFQTSIPLRSIRVQQVTDQFNELSGRIGGLSWLQIAMPQSDIQAIMRDIVGARESVARE